jgi:drug/metabolite transporter (DMT)-like permease
MSWFIFAVLSALFLSASSITEKRALLRVHSIDLSAALAFVNLIIAAPFLFFIEWARVSVSILFLIFGAALVTAVAFYLIAKAMRHLEISFVAPLLALTPGSTALAGFLVLGEALSRIDVLGIIFMIIGSYILALEPHHDFLQPIRTFVRSRYVKFVLISLVLYSLGATLDRAIVFDFEVPIANYMFFVHLFVAVLYLPMIAVLGIGGEGVRRGFKLETKNIIFISIFTVLYRLFQMYALSLAFVGLVSAIKRSSSFFTTLIGGELFHEGRLGRKLIASLIIIFGATLIVF